MNIFRVDVELGKGNTKVTSEKRTFVRGEEEIIRRDVKWPSETWR